jgi:phosphoglycolate phosphatase
MTVRATCRLVALDLDGTLVDSAPDLSFALGEALAAVGLSRPSETETRSWIGGGVDRLVRRALDAAGRVDEPTFRRTLEEFLKLYRENLFVRSRLYAGVPETLTELRATGLHLVCITNKRAAFANELLRAAGIRDSFELVYGGDSFPEKKPHPRQLNEAVRQTGIDAQQCVMVGDSEPDMTAAAAAGFWFVWASYGYCAQLPARQEDPRRIITAFTELPAALGAID